LAIIDHAEDANSNCHHRPASARPALRSKDLGRLFDRYHRILPGFRRLAGWLYLQSSLALRQHLGQQARPGVDRIDMRRRRFGQRAISTTEPTSASIRRAAGSTSCSIEVLCSPTASAPAMRLSMLMRKAHAELLCHGLGFGHHLGGQVAGQGKAANAGQGSNGSGR